MELEPWIRRLHEKVGPPRQSTERVVAYLQPRLHDLNPFWFTETALEAVFLKLRTLNSAERVRSALREFHAQPAPPPQKPHDETTAQMNARLADEWDDAAGIQDRIRTCNGEMRFLLALACIVARHAPMHLGLLPPHVLEAVARDPEVNLPILVELRRKFAAEAAAPGVEPVRSKWQQIEAITADKPSIARHLSPAQLDIVNPLPGGAKRLTGATR